MIDGLSGKVWGDILVVPIPLHKKRFKCRGFNQSELLARAISNYYDWPLSLNLIRTKQNKNQAELNEEERLNNVLGVFKWQGEELISRTILLVDDVITSGATLNEAEEVLLRTGASRVIKVAVAKG